MPSSKPLTLQAIESPEAMLAVENLCRLVWPGDDAGVVPGHLLLAFAHNGGVVVGAYDGEALAGFVFGFLGFTSRPGRPRLKHHSHQLAVHPDYRSHGLGFKLKRAQWQLVRERGLELITWTFDPLMSANARLNVAKLGAVCDTYFREVYGELQDGLNVGLPTDRFQVDWWVNSERVDRRLSSQPRRRLDLAHFLAADAQVINSTRLEGDWAVPPDEVLPLPEDEAARPPLLLVEIPADYQAMKAADMELALQWRLHTRQIFEDLFANGYLVTDFVYLPGTNPRSYYVLSRGDSALGD